MQISQIASHYDVVVVGGGMVGASFACALDYSLNSKTHGQNCQQREISILVVEAFKLSSEQTDFQPSFDARTTALSYGSSNIFQSFGLWQSCADTVTEISEIHVSDRGHFGRTQLSCQQLQMDALGFVIENRTLGRVLNQAMASAAGIGLLSPAKVKSIKPRPQGMELELDIGSTCQIVQAGLVVLADGGKSPICQQLGIVNTVERYQQSAIISNIAFSKPHNNTAYERFTDSGPLAVLPLAKQNGENRGALVWTVPEGEAKSLLEKDDGQLLALLQQMFGFRLGRISRIGERFCYPLILSTAKEQVRPGLVLLGNVAHTLHPVAGQGMNLALRDIDTLVRILSQAHSENKSLGSISVLQQYLNQQSKDQSNTINFTHYMTRLFSSNQLGLVWARKFGLFSIDLVPALKQKFARQAMGLADR